MRRAVYSLVAVALALSALAASASAANTVVSLTFDDGTATQYQAGQILADHGMAGTFYVNSSRLGTSDYYMTWAQVHALADQGNEIGGHTAHHVNLPQTDSVEAQRQICLDRVNLLNQGFDARDFAYPFGAFSPAVEQMVQGCGYNSARTTSPLIPESLTPADPYAVHQGSSSGDLTTLKNAVIQAEQSGGGWVPIVFHQICNACDTNWILPSDFAAFIAWLEPRAANGTVVERVQDVIGGPVKPAVAPPPPPPAPNGFNALKNSSLEVDANGDSLPDCWAQDGFGTNTFSWTRTSDAHTGSWAERLDVTKYSSGDDKLVQLNDLGFCTPSVIPGHSYVISAWYKSNAQASFTLFNRDSLGAFNFWTSSPSFSPASTWTKATWTTPVVPDGTTGLSFGLALTSKGSLTVDDLGLDDASPTGSGDTTPPTVSLSSPSANSTVSGTVPLTAQASDNLEIDHVDFIVDGTTIGTTSSTPYTFNWNSRSVTNATHTIAVRAVDTAGNATTTTAVRVLVANSVTNLLQNPSLETASGSTPTCWTLGGYGTNSFAWTRTTDAHSGGFAEKLDVTSLSSGDRKLVVSQSGTTCPVSAVPGHSYSTSVWYKSPSDPNLTGSRPVIFAYYLNSAGSWVYWTQSPQLPASKTWTQGTWSTPNLPAGATAISVGLGLQMTGTVTMDDFLLADNAPPPDVTAPTSAITCDGATDGAGCISGYYNDTVQVALSASDDTFGSGVAAIRYTTDGTTPTQTNGTTYSGAFAVPPPGATVNWRAYDNAGNGEAVHSQVINIDPIAPTSTISCDGTDCGSDWHGNAVSVSLDATDTGGSGLREIRYTTDGSTPTMATGKPYLGAFSLASTSTVKYRAYDNAGNREAVQSKLIQIDNVAPGTTISCNAGPCSSAAYPGSVDVTLNATDNIGGSGIAAIRYTTDGTDPTASNGTVYGPFSFPVTATTTVKYRATDLAGNLEPVNTQLIVVSSSTETALTLTNPTSGQTVSGQVGLSAVASDSAIASVDFQVDAASVGTSTSAPFTASWDSTAVGDGPHTVTALGYGSDGTLLDSDTADVTVANGDVTAPSTTIACNGAACSSDPYNDAVSVSLTAVDDPGGSGVQQIRYTTDGSDPTSSYGTTYGGTFSVAANTVIKYRAFDNAGNVEDVHSQTIQVDRVAPTSSIFCGGIACSSSYYSAAVSVGLAASDGGGSGVKEIRYTTDGSAPTSSNGTVFGQAFVLTSTTTVKYRAFDNAGNAEPVNSALIKIDLAAPTTAITCNGGSCAGSLKPGVSVALNATDPDSGVASTRYTLNGTDPTATTGTLYGGPFTVANATTVKYRSVDKVGNLEPVQTTQVSVDGTAPTVSLTSPSGGDLVSGTIALAANASDNVGVDHVDFLVDGTVVGTASSSPYTVNWNTQAVADGAHNVTATAVDQAGNTKTTSAVPISVGNTNLLHNPSLETATGSTPTCWLLGGYGTNTFTWTRTGDAHTGSFGESLTLSSLTSGDRKLVSVQDTGACAPSAIPGKTYVVSTWYKSADGPTLMAYYRNSSGTWVYWAQAPRFPSATSWTRRTWTTPAVPAGATALSVGPALTNTGSMTVDDIGLFAGG